MNYEFNLLHHVRVVAKRQRATGGGTDGGTRSIGNDNTTSGPDEKPLVRFDDYFCPQGIFIRKGLESHSGLID